MFMGVRSHHDAKRVTSYETAEAALERASLTPTGKRRTEKEKGFHLGLSRNHGVTWVKRYSDGSIGFTLYDTQVVTWQPDNSVHIDNFGSVTTSAFASCFLPAGISLRHPVEKRGTEGGDKGINYVTARDIPNDNYGEWHICHGSVVRFVESDDGDWVPDETTCDPIDLPVLDRSLSRGIAKELNLAEFASYLRMAPRMIDIEHDEWDLDQCVAALKARDWRRATETLPLIKPGSGFGLEERIEACALPVRTRRGEYVTMGSLDKLKLAMWNDSGCFDTERHMTIPNKAFHTAMRRVRELEALGEHGRWGLV